MTKHEFAAAVRRIAPSSVLVIDPDAHTPGAAYAETREDAPCWVWGGNKSGAPLACPDAADRILESLSPSLVIIERALTNGGQWAKSMPEQNNVRGGLYWACKRTGIPVVFAKPESWEALAMFRGYPGSTRKKRYRAYARERSQTTGGNEDADAALCIMDYTFIALGLPVPREIHYGKPPLTVRGISC